MNFDLPSLPAVPTVDPRSLQLDVLLWPVLFGIGLVLILQAQPIGRPKPNLAERLLRLDVDERIRNELERRDVARPIFATRWLEGILRPVLDDLGRLVRAVLSRFGLAGGQDLERKLRLARPGVEPIQYFGELSSTLGS